MTLIAITIIAAVAIYSTYNAFCLALFGIPKSLSMTFYLWQKRLGNGYLFVLMMYWVVGMMMPAWITMSEGSDFQFLAFLAPASLMFVATAPHFLSSPLENKVHTIAAYIAAACSLLWVILVTPYWWTILIWFSIVAVLAILTSSYRSSLVYWLETIAFGATFTSTIAYSLC